LLKAIKGAILVGKPLESGECRLTPMLGWSGALGRRSPNEYADRWLPIGAGITMSAG
jgi:hypothetical protein